MPAFESAGNFNVAAAIVNVSEDGHEESLVMVYAGDNSLDLDGDEFRQGDQSS